MSEETISAVEKNGGTPISAPNDAVCLEVAAHGMRGAGCIAPSQAGEIEPAQVTLREDMVVYALADEGVHGFEVVRTDGMGQPATAPDPVDVGSSRLFHVVLPTPAETLPAPGGLPMPPAVEVRTLDSTGKTLASQTLDVSHAGG